MAAFIHFFPTHVLAQLPPVAPAARPDITPPIPRPLFLGSPQEDDLRLAQLLGRADLSGSLIRAASTLPSPADSFTRARVLRWSWVAPYGEFAWNSDLAFSINDGAAWAGRGATASVAGGVQAAFGPAQVNFIPQLWTTQNQPFVVLPGGDPTRSGWASPWHVGALSVDRPDRFGSEPTTVFDFGESAAFVRGKGFAAGLSTESQWWGPAIRNPLLMSNNAGGIPHLFVRTTFPLRTPAGDLEGRWILGGLSESRFFDTDGNNDLRSLSGAVATYRPAIDSGLTIGIARVVYAEIPGASALLARSFDFIARWGKGGNVRAADEGHEAEQLTSLFARWVLPRSGAELYGEWGRMVLPASVKSFLVAPQLTQGFTVGLQWLPLVSPRSSLRVHAELTNLEQSPESAEADTLSFYTSRAVPQGYTHRGQVIGAAIGPGSSSQWLALDYFRGANSLGLFFGRIRWDTDAYYRQPTSILYLSYDVTVYGGIRATMYVRGRAIAGEIGVQQRYNYLFQNSLYGFARDETYDKDNVALRLRVY